MIIKWLTYLIESSVFLMISFLFYKSFFHKLTHFVWNRFYFLTMSFVGLILPWLKLPFSLPFDNYASVLEFTATGNDSFLFVHAENSSNFDFLAVFLSFIFVVYLSGVLRYSIIFIRNLRSINCLIKQNKCARIGKFKIVEVTNTTVAFSFLRFIFLSDSYAKLNGKEKQQVLEHEKIHALQLHSIDILFFELLEIFFWFSPFSKKTKRMAQQNHEFIVDETVKKQSNDYAYSQLMLKLSKPQPVTELTNNFAQNALKDRILLILKPEPKKVQKWRFRVAMPSLLSVIFAYLFITSIINNALNNTKNNLFVTPVGKVNVVSDYFINKKVVQKQEGTEKEYLLISHPEITYKVETNTAILAVSEGEIFLIEDFDNWGVAEKKIIIRHPESLQSVYKGLERAIVVEKEMVEKGQIIGYSGDQRLYPTISYQLLFEEKPINPNAFF